jgi:hypothetical protein
MVNFGTIQYSPLHFTGYMCNLYDLKIWFICWVVVCKLRTLTWHSKFSRRRWWRMHTRWTRRHVNRSAKIYQRFGRIYCQHTLVHRTQTWTEQVPANLCYCYTRMHSCVLTHLALLQRTHVRIKCISHFRIQPRLHLWVHLRNTEFVNSLFFTIEAGAVVRMELKTGFVDLLHWCISGV